MAMKYQNRSREALWWKTDSCGWSFEIRHVPGVEKRGITINLASGIQKPSAGKLFGYLKTKYQILRKKQHLSNVFCRLRLIEATGNAFKITLPNTNFHTEEQKIQNTPKTGGSTSMIKKEERINSVPELCRSKGSIVPQRCGSGTWYLTVYSNPASEGING